MNGIIEDIAVDIIVLPDFSVILVKLPVDHRPGFQRPGRGDSLYMPHRNSPVFGLNRKIAQIEYDYSPVRSEVCHIAHGRDMFHPSAREPLRGRESLPFAVLQVIAVKAPVGPDTDILVLSLDIEDLAVEVDLERYGDGFVVEAERRFLDRE